MMMKRPSLFAAFLLLSSAASAAEGTLTTVQGNCQVVNPVPMKAETASWSGPCVDGYAQGTGILEWHVDGKLRSRYEGEMQRGERHGQGYLKLGSTTEYEGGFGANKYHGKGIHVSTQGVYEGDWKNGMRHGVGKMKFALGGSYEGAWSNDKFHGIGEAVYAGGGKYTGQFNGGLRAGQAAEPLVEASYSLKSKDHSVGTWLPRQLARAGIPLDKPYQALTLDEKRLVRAQHPMLAEDDEPPYPVTGLKQISEWISKAQRKLLVRGDLLVHVKIDSEGNPVTASVYQTPTPELATFVSEVMMSQKYKPALCGGTPCAMIFPFQAKLTVGL